MRRLVLLFIMTALAGCSGELHVSPPDPPKNLSATFRVDIFGGEYVNLQWEDTNWSEDIGFAVHRDGAEIAVVDPECLAWDDTVCTDFRMYTSYYDYNVSRGCLLMRRGRAPPRHSLPDKRRSANAIAAWQ